MKEIKVLGSGCAKCIKTTEFIQSIATEYNIPVNVVKESNPEIIMNYGVMSTPAVVVDNILMHTGSIPDRKKVEDWLR
jgi:glutaredoxin